MHRLVFVFVVAFCVPVIAICIVETTLYSKFFLYKTSTMLSIFLSRKRAKLSGQFQGIVKGARKGAQKSKKGHKRK